MRTKTLLLTAATVVAGFLSAQADTVYSQNVVGYINITVPPGGFTLLGNQLVTGTDAAKTNNNVQAVLTNAISDANFISNTVLYAWNGAGYDVYYYFTDADAQNQFDPTFGNGWYTGGGAFANVSLNQGAHGGNFLKNASTSPLTITLVGQVLQGTNVISITPGFNTYSIGEPVSTNLNSALINFPGTSDPNFITNDVYYHYNGSGYDVLYYFTDVDAQNQFDPTFGDGWYTGGGAFGSTNPAVWPKVGEGFFIFHAVNSTKFWTNIFSVQ